MSILNPFVERPIAQIRQNCRFWIVVASFVYWNSGRSTARFRAFERDFRQRVFGFDMNRIVEERFEADR